KILLNNGFTALEVAPTRIVGENPYGKLPQAKKFADELLQNHSLSICSLQSMWYGKTENIFGGDNEFNTLLDYTFKAIDFAKTVGAKNLVLGCPRNRNMPEGANEAVFDDFLVKSANYATENGCFIALEANATIYNTNLVNDTATAFKKIRKLGAKGLSVNLDFGAIIYNKETLQNVADNLDLVSHVHISEPYMVAVENRTAHRELANILKNGGYGNFISVETKCQPLDLVKSQAEYISEVFG
ncbi:MAG: TIM barrel protein, partial [Oscillospiraceae bacterium]